MSTAGYDAARPGTPSELRGLASSSREALQQSQMNGECPPTENAATLITQSTSHRLQHVSPLLAVAATMLSTATAGGMLDESQRQQVRAKCFRTSLWLAAALFADSVLTSVRVRLS